MYKKLLVALSMLGAGQMAQASLFSGFKRLFNKRAAVIAQKVPVTQVQGNKISNVPTKKYDFSRKSGQSGKRFLPQKDARILNHTVRDAVQKQQVLGLAISKHEADQQWKRERIKRKDEITRHYKSISKHEADQQRKRERIKRKYEIIRHYKSLEQAGKDKALLDNAEFVEEILPGLFYEMCTTDINKSARQNFVDFMGSEVIEEGEKKIVYPANGAIQLLSRINVDQEDPLLVLHRASVDDVLQDDSDFATIDNELARGRRIMQDNIYEPDNIGCPAA